MIGGCVDAEVVEEREGERADDGNPVLGIGGKVGIAADGSHAVDGQRNLDALVVLGIGGIAGDATAVRIGELEVDAGGHVAVGCGAADIEAADFVFAAGVEAIVGRSDIAAEALHIAQLRAQAEYVASGLHGNEVVHGNETLVSHDGLDVAHIAPQARGLEGYRVFLAVVRADGVADGVVDVAEGDVAVDDAGQGIRTLDSGAERNGLEEGLRGGAEGRDRGPRP